MERKLEPKMFDYLTSKLEKNGLYKHAVEALLPRIVMCEAAKACVGIREATGHNDGEFIRLIQETVGGASGEPYCAAGVMTIIAFAEVMCGLKSPIPATELAQDIWNKTSPFLRVKHIPLPGAIAVWADIGKSTGHTEIVLAAGADEFHCVGFNTSGTTSPNGPIDREGNGVFFTVRSYKPTAIRKLLGFVKPFPDIV